MNEHTRTDLIKLAANGVLNAHPPTDEDFQREGAGAGEPTQVALTAQNLKQVPEAEQLAPGIRLNEPVLNDPESEPSATTTSRSSSAVLRGEPSTANVRPDPVDQATMPPELDPRTAQFKPRIPSAGSIFSVAVQPGSPKSVTFETGDKTHEISTTASPSSGSVTSSRANTPVRTGAAVPGHASRANSASVTFSDAGSDTTHTTSTEVREQEHAIELQRMHERATCGGGELGMGGNASHFPLSRLQGTRPERTFSSTATVSSSPAASVIDGGDSDAPPSPSLRLCK